MKMKMKKVKVKKTQDEFKNKIRGDALEISQYIDKNYLDEVNQLVRSSNKEENIFEILDTAMINVAGEYLKNKDNKRN